MPGPMPAVQVPPLLRTPVQPIYVGTPWPHPHPRHVGEKLGVWCHPGVAERFRWACDEAAEVSSWVPRRIDSYVRRPIRGSGRPSFHAVALAWDFYSLPWPQTVDVWGPHHSPSSEFADVFHDAGFTLGRDFTRRKDWPHVEWSRGVALGRGVLGH